ncbi:MAG TPA: paraquat-inducible protein A, partial [Puia sp.]|nr:paraquat-inducible protein A [Puia sp.]
KKVSLLLTALTQETYKYAYGLLATILVILGIWTWSKNKPQLYNLLFLYSVGAAFILLLVGVTTTMIELDARLKTLNFQLIGSTVSFPDEVLFFQSKSILSVVKILMDTGKIDMVLVGLLILCFSIFFPVAKLICACIHLLGSHKWASNKAVEFFAFKSGKWSMADVMVVAIMMAYIGLNGVLQSQLASMNLRSASITSITTNNTTLQPGYIVFVGFVLFGLFLSEVLKRITDRKKRIA